MPARLSMLQARLLPHGPLDVVRQVLLFVGAYLLYRLTRGLVHHPEIATFALMIGTPLSRLARRAVKVFWVAYPMIVVFVIVATANHFIAESVLGTGAATIGALAARALARTRPLVWTFRLASMRPNATVAP